MAGPAIAAAAIPIAREVGGEVKKLMDYPIIGYKSTTVRRTKLRTKTVEKSFQLRGWEFGAGILGLGALLVSAYALKIWTWNEVVVGQDKDGKDIKINLPAANRDGGKDPWGNETLKGIIRSNLIWNLFGPGF